MNRFSRRIDRLYEQLETSVPCVIAYSRNRLYFTDTVRPGLLYISPNTRVFYSTRVHEMAEEESTADQLIEVSSTGEALERIASRIPQGERVGLERQKIPASMDERIREALPVQDVLDVTGSIRKVRMKKDDFEIKRFRRAVKQSDKAHQRASEALNPGMEEVEFAADVESAARRAGHEGIMTHGRFDSYLPYGLISSGSNLSKMGSYAYVSHGTGPTKAFPVSAGHRVIEANDPVVVDVGGVHYGYNADVSRTYISGGNPSEKIRDSYRALEQVFTRIKNEMKAGVEAGQLYEVGVEEAGQTEFEDYFQGYQDKKGYFVGHGIGLEIDEPPVLSPDNETTLPAGATVTIEIFFVFPDDGGVKIEESCLVTEDGVEIVSSAPRKLRTVEPS